MSGDMKWQDAIELPFDDYMQWCNSYIVKKSLQNPILGDVFKHGAPMIQAMWAKRYWYHHCDKLNNDYV